jgi:hypothetical protein
MPLSAHQHADEQAARLLLRRSGRSVRLLVRSLVSARMTGDSGVRDLSPFRPERTLVLIVQGASP